jgi:hypothetical protein
LLVAWGGGTAFHRNDPMLRLLRPPEGRILVVARLPHLNDPTLR